MNSEFSTSVKYFHDECKVLYIKRVYFLLFISMWFKQRERERERERERNMGTNRWDKASEKREKNRKIRREKERERQIVSIGKENIEKVKRNMWTVRNQREIKNGERKKWKIVIRRKREIFRFVRKYFTHKKISPLPVKCY